MFEPPADMLLIVEDDEQLRLCLAGAMTARGFRVIAAGSVAESLIQVESHSPPHLPPSISDCPTGAGLPLSRRSGADGRMRASSS
jgi:ActR/RegA family two-component response regulator